MGIVISGIQQLGIGIPDVYKAWDWYGRILGFTVPVFDDPGTADNMRRYTGGNTQSRHAILAVNMRGGGGLEIWQYTSRKPKAPSFQVKAGDLGIYAARIKTFDINAAVAFMQSKNVIIIGNIGTMPDGTKAVYIKDPYGNIIRLEETGASFMNTKALTGGVIGALIGVSEMDAAICFYRDILGYDLIVYDVKGHFGDLSVLPGGGAALRRVLLGHSKPRQGAFSRLLGPTGIELIQNLDRKPEKIFKDRYWGDLGYIHLCFDIRGMSELRKLCSNLGCPFTVDSNPESGSFDMGEAAGCFAYIEDPDGTLIEFVETEKIPLVKKLGLYMNLKDRPPEKPLPDRMLKTLKWNEKNKFEATKKYLYK